MAEVLSRTVSSSLREKMENTVEITDNEVYKAEYNDPNFKTLFVNQKGKLTYTQFKKKEISKKITT